MNTYLILKHLHMTCALLSIAGFVLRGALYLRREPASRGKLLRIAPHVIDTVLTAQFEPLFRERGFVLGFWSENGFRHFGTRDKGVRKPEDLKGKRMRSQENPVHMSMYKAYGAAAVPIPTTEVPQALATGNVDGFEGPATVELWDWQQPRKLLAAGVEGQKGIINRLAFDPSGDWLIGAGGGNGGILAFWKVNPLPKPAGDERPAKDEKGKEKREADVPLQRVKFEGHIHDFCLSAEATDLYAAGHGKLEIWDLRG